MSKEQQLLQDTIHHFIQPGKGILAADESTATIGKRFATISVDNTEDNRRRYRELLATTPELGQYINGVILFEETFSQHNNKGQRLSDLFLEQGIIPGIKVDKGLKHLSNTDDEQITEGLDGLADRLAHFKELGARFAKWRAVYAITETTPSLAAIQTNASDLARYAATCQSLGIVPIVEPELLMEGTHDILHCAQIYEEILHAVFHALFIHQVDLETIILKPSMVTSGKNAPEPDTVEEVASYTLDLFRYNVPAAVPTINFLSGGQTPEQATLYLNAINSQNPRPWILSFSFGRALQEECLQAWRGEEGNIMLAQKTLLERARRASLACLGQYHSK